MSALATLSATVYRPELTTEIWADELEPVPLEEPLVAPPAPVRELDDDPMFDDVPPDPVDEPDGVTLPVPPEPITSPTVRSTVATVPSKVAVRFAPASASSAAASVFWADCRSR